MSDVQSARNLFIPSLSGVYARLSTLVEPLLRIVTGLLLMPHGAQKLFGAFGGGGLSGTAGFLESAGYSPGIVWAIAVGLVEFVGGACLALGLLTRPAAAAITIFLANAILFHMPNGIFWTSAGFEYPLLWTVCVFYFVIRGGGAYSLDARLQREF